MALVRRALLALPFDRRLLLLLRDQLTLRFEEIAAVTGAPVRDVKHGILLARSQLRDQLRDIMDRLS